MEALNIDTTSWAIFLEVRAGMAFRKTYLKEHISKK
jgi:hypothetical protein